MADKKNANSDDSVSFTLPSGSKVTARKAVADRVRGKGNDADSPLLRGRNVGINEAVTSDELSGADLKDDADSGSRARTRK